MSAMETDKVPLEKGSPEEILRKLGDNFGLDDGVVEALLRLGIENLQEFRFLWATEQAIETWIGPQSLRARGAAARPQRAECRSRAGGQALKLTTRWPSLLRPRVGQQQARTRRGTRRGRGNLTGSQHTVVDGNLTN